MEPVIPWDWENVDDIEGGKWTNWATGGSFR